MDISKILMLVCSFVLIVCLTLCITTLVVLRNAVAENNSVQENAAALVNDLNGCVEELNEVISSKEDSVEVSANPDTSAGADDTFYLREINGNIGIYTSDGYLIKLLDVSVETLPSADREALSQGISASSWKELLSLIEDYTA